MTMHKWMVGLCLAVVMVLALAANAMLFSARSFQHRLAELAPASSGVIHVPTFLAAENRIAGIESAVTAQRGEILAIQQEAAAIEAAVRQRTGAAAEGAARLAMRLAALEVDAGSAPGAVAGLEMNAAGFAARLETLAGQAATDDKIQTVAALNAELAQLDALERDAGQAAADLDAARLRLQGAAATVADADRQILGIRAQVVPGGFEQYDSIRNEVLALMRSSPLGIGQTLVQMHPHFLSSILVLLMGALGGILYLFPAYMSRTVPVTFAEIVVRMIFGMCAALAFYIVVNATIAGFAFSPGQTGGMSTALNPFSVSLIGIVAGVMADDIAKWIHERGSELLGGKGGQGAAASPAGLAPGPDDPYEGASGPGAFGDR